MLNSPSYGVDALYQSMPSPKQPLPWRIYQTQSEPHQPVRNGGIRSLEYDLKKNWERYLFSPYDYIR
jgi:hypothetical protein